MDNLKGFFSDLDSTVKENIDIAADGIDSTLDLMIEGGALDEIPLVKYAVSVCKLKDAYHAARLKRNVLAFKQSLNNSDNNKIELIISRLEKEHDGGTDIADTMMSVFIDSEKPVKAKIMGKLFNALAIGNISPEQYNDALLVVVSSSIVALRGLQEWFVATKGKPYGRSGNNEKTEYLKLPFLMSMGVAIHRGDEIFVNDIGVNIYKYGMC